MNLTRKRIPNIGSIISKTITKLFHILMNRDLKLHNDKKITTSLTAPDIWSKILGKTSVKKLLNECGCFKN